MSDHRRRDDSPNGLLIIAAAFIGTVVIVCITAVAIAVDDGARAASMIALIVGPLATLLAFLGLFVRVEGMRADVRDVKRDTTDLANGLGTAKNIDAVATVMADHLIDPDARDHIDAARKRIAMRNGAIDTAGSLLAPHADLD